MTDKPDAVHIIHIAASAQKVWDALTDADRSADYFFGNRWEFGEVGGDFKVIKPDGDIDSEGKVLVRKAPRLMRVTWKVVWIEELKDTPPGEVEWRLDEMGEVTRLTVSEFRRPPQMAPYAEAARNGWSIILSGLKTLVETGRPMPKILPEGPQ
jgi:uncharacterized protein YndB with AHSA1/START domain